MEQSQECCARDKKYTVIWGKKKRRMFLHGEISFEGRPVLAVPKGKVNKQTMWHCTETKPEGKAGQNVPRKYI